MARVIEVSLLGEYRDISQLRGIASVIFPQKAAEPSTPCSPGDRLISALIAGRSRPMVDITMKADTLANIQRPITTHR